MSSSSDLVSNLNLVILSLYNYIKDYFDATSWNSKYNLLIEGYPSGEKKTVIEDISLQDDTTIGLPILTILTGPQSKDPFEIGSENGRVNTLMRIQIQAKNSFQQNHLGEILQRLLDDTVINIYDYTKPDKPNIGSFLTNSSRVNPIYVMGDVPLGVNYNSIVEFQVEYDGTRLSS